MRFYPFFHRKIYRLAAHIKEQGIVFLMLLQEKNKMTIKKIFRENERPDLPIRNVFSLISTAKVIQKRIMFDMSLTKKDIALLLQFNQSQYFPDIREPLVFDYHLLSHTDHSQEYLVLGARQCEVENQKKRIHGLGLTLTSLEPESYALLRIVLYHYRAIQENQQYAALFLLEEGMRLIAFNHQMILYETHDLQEFQLFFSETPSLTLCFIVSTTPVSSDLIDEISERLKTTIRIINPLAQIDHSTSEFSTADFLLPFGAALRGI